MLLCEITDIDWDSYDTEPDDDFLDSFRVSDRLRHLSAGPGESIASKKKKAPKVHLTPDQVRQNNKATLHDPYHTHELKSFNSLTAQVEKLHIWDVVRILDSLAYKSHPKFTSPFHKFHLRILYAGRRILKAIDNWDLSALITNVNQIKHEYHTLRMLLPQLDVSDSNLSDILNSANTQK